VAALSAGAADDLDRAWCVQRAPLARRSEHGAGEARLPAAAHDQQIRFLGRLQQHPRRIPFPDSGADLNSAGLAASATASLSCLAAISSKSAPGSLRLPALQVLAVAPLLADAIGRLHHDQPLGDQLSRT
jgi:hypothetical protein